MTSRLDHRACWGHCSRLNLNVSRLPTGLVSSKSSLLAKSFFDLSWCIWFRQNSCPSFITTNEQGYCRRTCSWDSWWTLSRMVYGAVNNGRQGRTHTQRRHSRLCWKSAKKIHFSSPSSCRRMRLAGAYTVFKRFARTHKKSYLRVIRCNMYASINSSAFWLCPLTKDLCLRKTRLTLTFTQIFRWASWFMSWWNGWGAGTKWRRQRQHALSCRYPFHFIPLMRHF